MLFKQGLSAQSPQTGRLAIVHSASENALDDAKVDHEKKMIIRGHFAGTRAQHYTDRDIEQLREVHAKSYPLINVGPGSSHLDRKQGN